MTTIDNLGSSILQQAMTQDGIAPSTGANTTQSPIASPTPATSSPAGGTSVTLGASSSAPLTYNASGNITQAQAEQLMQTINTDVASTFDEMFSGISANSANSTSNSSGISSLSNLTSSTGSGADNLNLASILSAIPSSVVASNPSLAALVNSALPTANPSTSPTSTSATQTDQSAIIAAQNAVTNTLGSL